MENGRWIILIVGYIPLWEDSQWYVRKPTPELAEDCQLCWWKCEKRIILLICSYHCERIHRSISWNLRQNWQRIASSVGGNVRKRITLLICLYHCEKIHRNISWNPRQNWQRIASSVGGNVRKEIYYWLFIPLWEDSQEHILKPTSELAKDCQFWWREMSKKELHNWLCKYHCERIHNGIYITMKPTSELKKDF